MEGNCVDILRREQRLETEHFFLVRGVSQIDRSNSKTNREVEALPTEDRHRWMRVRFPDEQKIEEWEDRVNDNLDPNSPFDAEMGSILKQHDNILEIGCGTGKYMAAFPGKITGLEYSTKFAEKARSRNVGKVVQGNAFKVPFDDSSFDMAFSTGLIEHYRDRQKLVNEHVRVIKKGGLCLISVPAKGPDGYLVGLLRDSVYSGTKKHDWSYLGERMGKNELGELLVSAGLKDVKMFHAGFVMRGQPMAILRKHGLLMGLSNYWAFVLHGLAYGTTTKIFRLVTANIITRLFSRRFGHALIGVGTK